jgi:hypothetical protein
MGSILQSQKFRMARRIFRWTRIVLWFGIFLVVAALAYLHLIGLPDLVKGPLLARLQQAGFEARFTSVQLGWGPDLEIENAFFRRAAQPLAPRLSAARARFNFDLDALRRRRLRIRSFQVEDGRLEFPLSATNGESLSVNNVVLGVDFPGADVLQIAEAAGNFRGMRIALNGTVTNYAALRDWKPFHLRPRTNETFQEQLHKLAQTLDQIHFRSSPQFHFHATADGSDPDTLRAEMALSAAQVRTPWGQAQELRLSASAAHLVNSETHPVVRAQFSCAQFSTPDCHASQLDLTTVLSRNADSNLEGAINFSAAQFHCDLGPVGTNNWLDAARILADGRATFAAKDFAPLAGAGKVQAGQLASRTGSAQQAQIDLTVYAAPPSPAASTNWGLWTKLDGYSAQWQARFVNIASPALQIERFNCSGQWRGPMARLDNIDARLYGGQVTASASLDVDSREIRIKSRSDVDPHRVAQLLTEAAQRFLEQYDWEKPPEIEADTRLVLPPWSHRPPGWQSQVLATLQLAGQFSVASASFHHLPAASAQSHFTYTNRVWDLPHLHAMGDGGELYLDFTGDEVTREFHFAVDSRMNPKAVGPLLPPAARVWLDDLRFTGAPAIHGQVWGRWRAHERDGFKASVAVTNFWFRGERIDGLDARVEYTNRLLRVADARLSQAGRQLSASLAEADLSTKKCTATNVFSTLDLNALMRVLGPRTPKFLDVIRFDTPPAVKLFGSFVANDPLATDLHFAVSGEHFHWTNLTADKISGLAHWQAREVALTNVQASLYGSGTLEGWGVFDYQPREGADFRGRFSAKDVNLGGLVRGWSKAHSRVEGMLDGHLLITGGNSNTNTSWNGYGDVHAHDALLWDIPIFGVFSPLLNAISSGMGDSRAHDAGANFVITNGVVGTDNLEIRAPGLALLYHGTLAPGKRINARVEAQVLHDIPALGPMLGLFLTPLSKLFEYKISGTIDQPVMQPLFIPRFLMMVLRPFHTMKTLLPSGPAENPAAPSPKAAPK